MKYLIILLIIINMFLCSCSTYTPSHNELAYWEFGCGEGYSSDCADLFRFFNEKVKARKNPTHWNP